MTSTSAAHEFEDPEVASSPFRVAFGRARFEALSSDGPARVPHHDVAGEPQSFEYRLVKRRGKRSVEEVAWNELGLEGWELIGVTGKLAAFKRRVAGNVSR
jgi:hypothetical protein